MGFKIDFHIKSDIGTQRSRNEDHFGIIDKQHLCLIADGMGGQLAGDIASHLAIDTIFNYFEKAASNCKKKPNFKTDEDVIKKAIQYANYEVFNRGSGNLNLRDMGTTVVASWFRSDYAVLASVGDSRIYLLRDNQLFQRTTDHSWVGELVKRRLLPASEAVNHPLRNIITRAIGIEKKVIVDAFKEELLDGDIFLLCTDGLTDYVEDFRIKEIIMDNLNDLDAGIAKLIETANFIAGADNITIALISVKKIRS